MNLFRGNLSYSGLRRMFAGLFIVIFIGVNTGNLLLYTLFSSALTTEIKTGSLRTLTKVKNATELVYEGILSFSIRLGHGDITLTRLMFEKEWDRLLEYQAHQVMQSALVSYPYLDYLAVYNERLDGIFGTRYFTPATEAELKRLARGSFQSGIRNLTFPLTIRYIAPSPETAFTHTVTLIVYSPLSLAGDTGALLVGLDCGYFQRLVSKMDEGDLETVMILHGNGQVLSHPDPGELLQSYGDKDYPDSQDSGFSMRKGPGGTETYISYTRSGILGWTFVSLVPHKKITSKLVFLRNLTLAVTIVILCAGLFISYLLALRMYRPMRRILNRLDYAPGKSRPGPDENEYIEKRIDDLRAAAVHIAGIFEEARSLLEERFFSGPGTAVTGQDGKKSPPPLVQDAVKLTEEKYRDHLFSINTAAACFNVTPAYFNRVFKKYRRVSYSEFLNEYRMERACGLLKETGDSIAAVAASVGISNATYFYTLFKRIYNMTPQQFRASQSIY